MKVLCVGKSVYENVCLVDAFPIEGVNLKLNEVMPSTSGSATLVSMILASWGVNVAISSAVGDDENGKKIKNDLASLNVNIDSIETNYGIPTNTALRLLNKSNNASTNLEINNNVLHLKRYDFKEDYEYLYFDETEAAAATAAYNKNPNAIIVASANSYDQSAFEISKLAKYLISSLKFAEGITGITTVENNSATYVELYNKMKMKFPNKEIVINLNNKSVLYKSGENIKIMPGLNVNSKDSTSCSDVFAAAFVYSLINKFDIEKTISFASIASGLSSQNIGSKTSIPPLVEVINMFNQKVSKVPNAQ